MTTSGQNGDADTAVEPAERAGETDLDARYGRTALSRRRERLIAWVGAAAFVLIFAAWVLWVSLDGTSATIEAQDIGHDIVDDRTATISWNVSMSPGLSASCALQVQNDAHAIVGWEIVDIPAAAKFTQTFTEQVRTTELGVTGLIYRCWLT